jgi:dipeptidyl aminopeptidase/acylaminoacyl peptidase
VSQTGVLVYRTGAGGTGAPTGPDEQRSLIWVDRNGGRVDQIGTAATYAGVDLAPDGKRFAVHRHEASGGDNWVFDIAQGRMQRLTFDATQDNHAPIWSPDGARIAFASRRSNKWGLYLKPADGTGAEELLTESDTLKTPMSFSPDGKLLVYAQNTGGGSDVWAVPLTGERKPFGILQAPIFENYAQVSPDGKWLAYQSNETGRPEIYVRQFPDGPGKWQVSTDGGNFPRWRRDGKELYFLLAPNIMEVEIRVVGSSLQAGVPQTLFGINNPNATIPTRHDYHRFAVTADGQRFLLSQPGGGGPVVSGGLADSIAALADQGGSIAGAPSSAPQAVTVVLNWPQLTKKK